MLLLLYFVVLLQIVLDFVLTWNLITCLDPFEICFSFILGLEQPLVSVRFNPKSKAMPFEGFYPIIPSV